MAEYKYLWLAVTADKYELPMFVEKSCTDLARKLDMPSSTVSSAIFHNVKKIRGHELRIYRIANTTEGE